MLDTVSSGHPSPGVLQAGRRGPEAAGPHSGVGGRHVTRPSLPFAGRHGRHLLRSEQNAPGPAAGAGAVVQPGSAQGHEETHVHKAIVRAGPAERPGLSGASWGSRPGRCWGDHARLEGPGASAHSTFSCSAWIGSRSVTSQRLAVPTLPPPYPEQSQTDSFHRTPPCPVPVGFLQTL